MGPVTSHKWGEITHNYRVISYNTLVTHLFSAIYRDLDLLKVVGKNDKHILPNGGFSC